MENKDKYKKFCLENKNIPIFSQPWWLDVVSEEGNWDVILYEEKKEVVAAFPFFYKKKGFLKIIVQPKFTQKLGPIIMNNTSGTTKILNHFINNMPNYNYMDINWHHQYKNWLPFYWNKFSQETMYTCIIKDLDKIDHVYKNFSQNRKHDINKSKASNLKINFDLDAKLFFREHEKNLRKRNFKISYKEKFLENLFLSCKENNSGRLIGISDHNNNYLSICFIVWDSDYAYLIGLSSDPDKIKSGATSMLIFESLKFLRNKAKNFDFEGSMNQNIYSFYKSFGSERYEYYKIKSFKPKIIEILEKIVKNNK